MQRKMHMLPVQANGDHHEPMELDIIDSDDRDEIPVQDEVNLDLESYISPYQGLPRIYRLEFIANHCVSLRVEALQLALDYIKENTYNVKDYLRLFKQLQSYIGDGDNSNTAHKLDQAWVDAKSKQASLRFERLENDLKNFRTNSMKENIRRGQDDLGDHHLDCGDLEGAYNAYSRSRDYAITDRSRINQCLNMIRVSILLKRWLAVTNNVNRAESAPVFPEDTRSNPAVTTKINCAAGLIELHSRKYKKAARHFLSANFDQFTHSNSMTPLPNQSVSGTSSSNCAPCRLTSLPAATSSASGPSNSVNNSFGGTPAYDRDIATSMCQWDVITPVNIAVYGSLCALATYSRQELANYLINSPSFKQFSELDPQIREAVSKFYESKYAACLGILKDIKNVLWLDMYLAPHVERLYKMIRNKALIQYFEPYSTASMHQMASAFQTTVSNLEEEVKELIHDGSMKARIDSHNKILYARSTDPRTLTFEKAIAMGKKWQRQTQALISRTAIINANLSVTTSNPILPDRTTQ